jgi:hypothetical protein
MLIDLEMRGVGDVYANIVLVGVRKNISVLWSRRLVYAIAHAELRNECEPECKCYSHIAEFQPLTRALS